MRRVRSISCGLAACLWKRRGDELFGAAVEEGEVVVAVEECDGVAGGVEELLDVMGEVMKGALLRRRILRRR